MVFTTQLDRLEGKTAQEAVRSMANHIRRMQEELEYRLSVLDSSNICEIDAARTAIRTEDGELCSVLRQGNERHSSLSRTVDGLQSELARWGEEMEQVSTFSQTVEGFRLEVEQYTKTVGGYTQQVSAFNQTAEGLSATVKSIVTNVGGGGTVTAATIAARIREDESLISMIADKVDITGVVSVTSGNNGTGSAYREVVIDDGAIGLISGTTPKNGFTSYVQAMEDGLHIGSYDDGAVFMEPDGNFELSSGGKVSMTAAGNLSLYTNKKAFLEADAYVDITAPEIRLYAGGTLWEFLEDGIYADGDIVVER